METLQLSAHIENNREVSFIVPEEYVNQDVELVVIIQPCEKIKVSAENRLNETTQQTIIEARAGENVADFSMLELNRSIK